ncbi:MAG TPA: DUF3570 domain-containing protein [Kofleriaceae bacterium]|nr:DUF3570 domain-containing protein [Kofleriaceae bacterium]
MQLTPARGLRRSALPGRLPAAAGAIALALALAPAGAARAGGEVTVRGAYYKERATRVAQPMLDARFDVGDSGELSAHTLIDSISSASVAAGAAGEPFDENRYELGATYLHRIDRFRFGGGARGSVEPDYESVFVHLRGEAELASRNTVLSLALAGGRDSISNAGAQSDITQPIEGTLYTAMGSLSLSQILSPLLVGQVTYDLIRLDGFQENPYRSVAAGGMLEPERVPETRLRHAVLGALRAFVPVTRSTLVGSYRFYADDWGVIGHTPEVRLVQELTADVDLHLRYRLHLQGAADFYQEIYDTADPAIEPWLTDDVKLSELTTHTLGVKLDLGLSRLGAAGALGAARVGGLFEYIFQSTYYGNAISAQLAVTVPFDY